MNKVSWWRTTFGQEEVQKLGESVAEQHISQGPVTEELESKVAEARGVQYVAATTSGSSALMVALVALGIGRGDEVIIPNRSWISTAHAVFFAGAKAVFVDVLPDVPVIDTSKIREKITPSTKAIMPVHLAGRSCDMDEIRAIADEHDLLVVEDACQALFSRNSSGYLGAQSDAGCFSLAVTKLISTGQGGLIATNNRDTWEALKLVGNNGVADIFTDTWTRSGFNFKYTDLLASFGLVQMTKVSERISHVTELYSRYASALAEFSFLRLIPVNVEAGEIPLYVEVLCDDRQPLIDFLEDQGIQTRALPPDMHLSDYLESTGEFPNSNVFSERGLMLPSGPTQPLESVDRVADALRLYGKKNA